MEDTQRIVHYFSSGTHELTGTLPPIILVRAAFGMVRVDLRNAIFTSEQHTIHVYSSLASVRVEFPHGVNIYVNATGLFGAFGGNARYAFGNPDDAPRIAFRGFALFGGVGGFVDPEREVRT